ncbi:MAG: acyltransferase [Alcaligenaceae bacterium]|nr:acyltransferase [Alcaligenaceae bacterium]
MSYSSPAVPAGTTFHSGYRPDIDGLRAVAVLAVLVFHAFPALLPGGFIGVDIFFVISGFLITRIVAVALNAGSFSLTDFFSRRIRRIFPALILVLITCMVAGWFVLTPGEYTALGKHVLAGAGFVSNLVLSWESSYFDQAAELKPLLHLWSLGIEEQFYLFWPVVLMLAAWRRMPLWAVALGVGLLSFGWNVAWVAQQPSATFYWPMTRVWELLAGALLALAGSGTGRLYPLSGRVAQVMAWAGLALLLAGLLLINRHLAFPGFWAVLPVLGAVLLVAAGPTAWVNRRVLAHPVMVRVGLISFPLYLWHWPLLAFALIHQGETPPVWVRLAALALAFVLATVTWRWVEQPLRHGGRGRFKVAGLVVAMVCVGGAGAFIQAQSGFPGRPGANVRMDETAIAQERLSYWASTTWDNHFGQRDTNIMVFGDSQGFDVFKALSLDDRLGVRNFESSFDCTAFNQPIAGKENQAARCIELFERLFQDRLLEQADVLIYSFSWFKAAEPADALPYYQAAIDRLRARNPALRIVFIGPKPWLGRTWVSINAITRGQTSVQGLNDFLNSIMWVRHDDIAHVKALSETLQTGFIDASAVYCHGGCVFYNDSQFAYFDQNHWTRFGAQLFMTKLQETGSLAGLIGP